jgi:hypothetical protein
MGQMSVGDQAKLFQQFQGAIDSGDIHPGRDLANRHVHLLGGGMAEPKHRLQHKLTLGGQSQTL